MEVVLGIDNLVFISILTGRLPDAQRRLVTRIGGGGALVMRASRAGQGAVTCAAAAPIL
ncbi:MAG: hypothetical protein IT380_16950 [Myxococcales bacterium]|nr:hypothetical protein [Myxococcales bacterium]